MSKEAEARILGGLDDIAVHLQAGQSPNAAIVKVAQDRQLLPGHVRLLVNAYNTGRTLNQFQEPDLLEKLAEFETADADQILAQLYPAMPKTAADLRHASAVSAEYASPPRWYRPAVEKTAAAPLPPLCSPPPALPSLPGGDFRRAQHAIEVEQSAVDELRLKTAQQHDRFLGTIEKLATYFATPGHRPYADVRFAAERLMPETLPVLDYLAGSRPALTKEAAALQPEPVDLRSAPYTLLQDCCAAANLLAEQQQQYLEKVAAAQTAARQKLRPFIDPEPTYDEILGIEKEALGAVAAPGQAGGPAQTAMSLALVRDLANKLTAPQKVDDRHVDKYLSGMNDPAHSLQLRQIRAQAVLHDLLSNDEVLRSYDPVTVANAFNQISQIAPRAAEQPLMLQALLRKQLTAGALDTFDVDQVVGTEDKLHKMRQPTTPAPVKAAEWLELAWMN